MSKTKAQLLEEGKSLGLELSEDLTVDKIKEAISAVVPPVVDDGTNSEEPVPDPQHQDDPTTRMSIDEKITPNTQTTPSTFDISQPVIPGHDMVINHLDGTQELGTGNEMLAVTAAEAESGSHVPLSDIQPQPKEILHRSVSDPEVNGPDQELLKAEV